MKPCFQAPLVANTQDPLKQAGGETGAAAASPAPEEVSAEPSYCLLIFSRGETDPFGKRMPHKSYVTEGRESELFLKLTFLRVEMYSGTASSSPSESSWIWNRQPDTKPVGTVLICSSEGFGPTIHFPVMTKLIQ